MSEKEILRRLANDFRLFTPPLDRDPSFFGRCPACDTPDAVPKYGFFTENNPVKYCLQCYRRITSSLEEQAKGE